MPLRQTELEVQFVEMTTAELQALPLQFYRAQEDNIGDDQPRIALTDDPSLIRKQLNQGIADGRTTIIMAPRVTAIDGLAAQLTSTERRPVTIPKAVVPATRPAAADTDQAAPPTEVLPQWQPGLALIEEETGIRATIVSKEDLLALDLQLNYQGQVAKVSSFLRDGQMLAIWLPQRNAATGKVLVALAIPRVIRRVEN